MENFKSSPPKTAYKSLEAVNALHETIVTLRKSLQEAKLEINSLKSQITVLHSIEEGKSYRCQDIVSHEDEPGNKNTDREKNYENYDTYQTSSIVSDGSELSHCQRQQSKNDTLQNDDGKDQSAGSYIETETQENIFKIRMTANMDVKIRLTSSVTIRDRSTDSVENTTLILNGDKKLSTISTSNSDSNEEIVNSLDKPFQSPFEEEAGAVGGANDSGECLDDIELIFSSGDKQYLQDEPWQLCGQSGTSVLIKFRSIFEIEGIHDSTAELSSSSLSPITKDHRYSLVDPCIQSKELRLKYNFSEDGINRYHELRKRTSNCNEETTDDNVLKRPFEPVLITNARNHHQIRKKIFPETNIFEIVVINEKENVDCRIYRPLIHRNALGNHLNNGDRKNWSTPRKFTANRTARNESNSNLCHSYRRNEDDSSKRSISAQTDISALSEHWRSDSHLSRGIFMNDVCTFSSNLTNSPKTSLCDHLLKDSVKRSDKGQRRRVLLSDIKFTSMVPEISRSADQLFHVEEDQNSERAKPAMKKPWHEQPSAYSCSGVTEIGSPVSPEELRWSAEDKRRGIPDSNQSIKKHSRTRSCPLKICKNCLNFGKPDRSRILFRESKSIHLLKSLPNIDKYTCSCHFNHRAENYSDSCGSTENLLHEANDFLHELADKHLFTQKKQTHLSEYVLKHEGCSENEMGFDFSPPVQSSPFLPTSMKCLKTGYLAKVITKDGRLVIGHVRYIGPLVSETFQNHDEKCAIFIGLQLRTKVGNCDGSFEGRKIFDCEPRHGLFVPFKKIVMAWKT